MWTDTTQHWPRLFSTETGLAALRTMMYDPRLADPVKSAHIPQELGIDPAAATKAVNRHENGTPYRHPKGLLDADHPSNGVPFSTPNHNHRRDRHLSVAAGAG